MLNAFDSLFLRMLAARLEEADKAQVQQLRDGRATTFEDYKGKVGYLKALSDVAQWCKEIDTELSKPEGERGNRG